MLKEIAYSLFGDPSPERAKKGQIFELRDIQKFTDVMFAVRRFESNGELSDKTVEIDLKNYKGSLAVCIGKGGGGHPQFQIWPHTMVHIKNAQLEEPEELFPIVVSTTYMANGNPQNYGMSRKNHSPSERKEILTVKNIYTP